MNSTKTMLAAICGLSIGFTAQASSAGIEPGVKSARDVEVISREVLFGNPERASFQASPDGKTLSWLAPKDGVLNVYVAPIDDIDNAKAVTNDDYRGIRQYFWAENGTHIIYMQDTGGDENFHAYSVNLETGERLELTPFEGARAQIQ